MRVTVLGDTCGNALLEGAGAEVRSNVRPEPGDLVLIAVSARAGLMPPLLDALDLAEGYEAGRLAVLVTDARQCPDPELVELVAFEVMHLLEGTGVVPYMRAESLPVLRADDPDLRRALSRVNSAEPSFRLSKADRND